MLSVNIQKINIIMIIIQKSVMMGALAIICSNSFSVYKVDGKTMYVVHVYWMHS